MNTMKMMLSANCFPSSLTSKEFRPILALLHFVQECKYFQQHRSQTNQLQTKFEKKRYSRSFLDYLLNLHSKCVLGRHWHWQEALCPHLLFKAPAIKSIMRVCGFTTLYGDQNIISVCMCLVWAAVHMVLPTTVLGNHNKMYGLSSYPHTIKINDSFFYCIPSYIL